MYNYPEVRPEIFTDSGRQKLEVIRQKVSQHLGNSPSITLVQAISGALGDTWVNMACVDRMVELGELEEIDVRAKIAQDRTFRRPSWHQDQSPGALARYHWNRVYELSDPENRRYLLEIQNRG